MNEWIGTVLAALGEHIRRIEDENASHRAFRRIDRDQIHSLAETVDRAIRGTPDEALSLELNEKIEEIRRWVSWAGQARMFRKDALSLICDLQGALPNSMAISYFMSRVNTGHYDVIAMPGELSDGPVSIDRAGDGAPPLAPADE